MEDKKRGIKKGTTIKLREFPTSKNGKTCDYLGYTFFNDGTVITSHGRELELIKEDRETGPYITLIKTKKGKRQNIRINLARAIYSMFSGKKLSRTDVVALKDISKKCSFDNLEVIKIKDVVDKNVKNGTHGRQPKFTKEEAIKIIEENKEGYSDVELTKKYDCSLVTIQKILNRNYCGYDFKETNLEKNIV